jgi:PKD repeat protein
MKSSILFIFFIAFIAVGCNRKEVKTVLDVKFKYTILNNNYSVPVLIQFENNTTGATNFKWTFEGGSPTEYTQKEPGIIQFNKPGSIKVTLEAWNSTEKKTVDSIIILDSAVKANFEPIVVINDFAPAEFNMNNISAGATLFNWQFPASSTITTSNTRTPATVKYDNPGIYTIQLEVKNAKGVKDTISKKVTVRPGLSADFEMIPSFDDDDMEAPLTATLSNHTISATSHQWTCSGAIFANANDSSTSVTFNNSGTYAVQYVASNGKQTQTVSKTIVVKPNTFLRTFQNVHLGINTAQNTIGCYFSTKLRAVFKPTEVNTTNGSLIDIAFFGLSESFSLNKFISPDSVTNWTFSTIPNATHTIWVNKQETCSCNLSFTESDFNALANGNALIPLNIVETVGGMASFNNTVIPRIILFKNSGGKKGVIKLKQLVNAGQQSYVIVDIKVQKD